jgi:hypothetical protein
MFQLNPYTRGHGSPFPTQTCAQKRNFATSKRIGNKNWSNRRHDNATSDTHACHTQNTTLPQKKKLPLRTRHNSAEPERNTCHAQDATLPCQDKIFWGKKKRTHKIKTRQTKANHQRKKQRHHVPQANPNLWKTIRCIKKIAITHVAKKKCQMWQMWQKYAATYACGSTNPELENVKF